MANSVNRYFEGVLVGGILGFVVGLLTAPKPGIEMRRELVDSADDMYKHASDNWLEIKDKMNDRIQPIGQKADVYKNRVVSQASDLRSRVAERTSDLKEQAELLKDKLSEKAGAVRDIAAEKTTVIKEKAEEIRGKTKETGSADLVNNYMGNNSGPMYTAGSKVSPESRATQTGEPATNYNPIKDQSGADNG